MNCRRSGPAGRSARPEEGGRSRAQPFQQRLEVRRWRRFELAAPAVAGMVEREAPRMQRVALELDRTQRPGSEGVALLADERVAAEPRLNADLIAPPAVQPHFDQRRLAVPLADAVVADRFLRRGIARMRLLLDQRLLVPHQMIPPAPFARRRMAVDHGEVDALGLAAFELRLEP